MDPQQLSDLVADLEIKSLLVRERSYRDTCQWEKLRRCYHPDAAKTHIKITWFCGDVDGFVSGSEKMAKGGASATHSVCPIEVTRNGDLAVAESTGSIMIRFQYQHVEFDCTSYARFMSKLERVEGEWRMLTLEVIYDKDAIVLVKPDGSKVSISLDADARPSYKCIAWVLGQKGFKIDPDLPGTDIPGSGEKLREDNLSWLRNGK